MGFKLDTKSRQDSSEGLGLFAGDRKHTSAFQYGCKIVIGVAISTLGGLALLAVFLSAGQDVNRTALGVFGAILIFLGLVTAHDGVIFFALRRHSRVSAQRKSKP